MPFLTISIVFLVLLISSSTNRIITECKYPGLAALTFDDGPHITTTPHLLEVLHYHGVKATFFVVGPTIWETQLNYAGPTYWNEDIKGYAKAIRRYYDQGHQIGNHCWSHPHLKSMTTSEIRTQIGRLAYLIRRIIGGWNMTVFRPPFGEYDDRILKIVEEEFGYTTVSGNIDLADWSHPNNIEAGFQPYVEAVENSETEARSTSYISVSHEFTQVSPEVADRAIRYLKSKNMRIVTVSECIGIPMYR